MDKKFVSSIAGLEQQQMSELSFAFSELGKAEEYLNECEKNDITPDTCLLIFLLSATREKIRYFQEKYDFEVDGSDIFYIEDFMGFLRKAERLRISRHTDSHK